jgi:hypothetical protein
VRNESVGNMQGTGISSGSARIRGRAIRVAATVVVALAIAAPASANPAATATVAPIGAGSYVLTITNTGSEAITDFIVDSGEESPAKDVVPSPACVVSGVPFGPGSIVCTIAIAPGASAEMCYTGHALLPLFPGESVLVETTDGKWHIAFTSGPAVGSCPVPGFKTGSSVTGGASKCIVPGLKGKTLVVAEKAITRAHCAVGKIKKASSSHVKKGHVVSQTPAAGRALSKGAKVSLVVSKGK